MFFQKRQLFDFRKCFTTYSRMKKFWLLNDLFVHPESRSKGVSIALIEKAKALVRESKACSGVHNDKGKGVHLVTASKPTS